MKPRARPSAMEYDNGIPINVRNGGNGFRVIAPVNPDDVLHRHRADNHQRRRGERRISKADAQGDFNRPISFRSVSTDGPVHEQGTRILARNCRTRMFHAFPLNLTNYSSNERDY